MMTHFRMFFVYPLIWLSSQLGTPYVLLNLTSVRPPCCWFVPKKRVRAGWEMNAFSIIAAVVYQYVGDRPYCKRGFLFLRIPSLLVYYCSVLLDSFTSSLYSL